jgi:hypothetical protein
MVIVRFFANGVIMAFELAMVIAVAWLGYRHPFLFAGLTTVLAFTLGAMLEYQRLANELPFYFESGVPKIGGLMAVVAGGEALLKAALAGLVALLTFAGTDQNRLFWDAVVFGVVVYIAANLLGSMAWRFGIRPVRWGYFRLAAPLGLLFSIGIAGLVAFAVLRQPSLGEVLQKGVFETAQRPTVAQASELLYLVKMWFDGVIGAMLSTFIGPQWAPLVAVLLSVNVLTGFVVAVYAVVIAEMAIRAERMLP